MPECHLHENISGTAMLYYEQHNNASSISSMRNRVKSLLTNALETNKNLESHIENKENLDNLMMSVENSDSILLKSTSSLFEEDTAIVLNGAYNLKDYYNYAFKAVIVYQAYQWALEHLYHITYKEALTDACDKTSEKCKVNIFTFFGKHNLGCNIARSILAKRKRYTSLHKGKANIYDNLLLDINAEHIELSTHVLKNNNYKNSDPKLSLLLTKSIASKYDSKTLGGLLLSTIHRLRVLQLPAIFKDTSTLLLKSGIDFTKKSCEHDRLFLSEIILNMIGDCVDNTPISVLDWKYALSLPSYKCILDTYDLFAYSRLDSSVGNTTRLSIDREYGPDTILNYIYHAHENLPTIATGIGIKSIRGTTGHVNILTGCLYNANMLLPLNLQPYTYHAHMSNTDGVYLTKVPNFSENIYLHHIDPIVTASKKLTFSLAKCDYTKDIICIPGVFKEKSLPLQVIETIKNYELIFSIIYNIIDDYIKWRLCTLPEDKRMLNIFIHLAKLLKNIIKEGDSVINKLPQSKKLDASCRLVHNFILK